MAGGRLLDRLNETVRYAEKTCRDDEQIIYRSRFHRSYTLLSYLPLSLIVFVTLIMRMLMVPVTLYVIPGLLSLPALAFLSARLFRRAVNCAIVTNKRLIYRQGFTEQKIFDLGLDRLLGHKLNENVWGRFFGYGQITIVGAGIGEIKLHDFMADPAGFRRALTGKVAQASSDHQTHELGS
jgi:hypothetical protein